MKQERKRLRVNKKEGKKRERVKNKRNNRWKVPRRKQGYIASRLERVKDQVQLKSQGEGTSDRKRVHNIESRVKQKKKIWRKKESCEEKVG